MLANIYKITYCTSEQAIQANEPSPKSAKFITRYLSNYLILYTKNLIGNISNIIK